MTQRPEQVMADVQEIHRLLGEAYDHYFATTDGYCKPSEGYVELNWPNYFDMKNGKTEPGCGVYSYVLGPSRMHDFDSTAEALAAVREWHREEMGRRDEEESPEHCPALFPKNAFTENEPDVHCDLDAGHEGGHMNADNSAAWWDR